MKKLFTYLFFGAFLLNKVDAQIVFNRNYDMDSLSDESCTVIQTLDGGYFTGGTNFNTVSGATTSFVLKTNSMGDTLWTRVWDFSPPGGDQIRSVLQLSDSSYIAMGNTYNTTAMNWDVFLLKLNTAGDTLWMKTYSIGTGIDLGYMLKQTTDGGFIIAGRTTSNTTGPEDAYLIKTDNVGNLQWQHQYGGLNVDEAYSLDLTTDGGYILGGDTYSYGAGGEDLYMIKVNSVGIFQWKKTFGTSGDDYGETVITTLDGGYAISGAIDDGTGTFHGYIVKTDNSGNMQWNKTFGYYAGYESLNLVKQLTDSTYVLAGSTYLGSTLGYQGWLMKINSIGDSLWSRTYADSTSLDDYFYGIDKTSDGGFILCGFRAYAGYPFQNAWLVKTDCMGNDSVWDSVNCSLTLSINENGLKNEKSFNVYPNPFSFSTTLEITTSSTIKYDFILYDQLGREVKKILNIDEKKITIEKGDLNSGMYFYKATSKENIMGTGKLIIN
jgi:hypothetical protein